MINALYLISLFILFPLGEVTRYQFGNGSAISLFDLAALVNLLAIILIVIKKKNVFSYSLIKPLLIFIGVCILSLIFNLQKLPILSAGTASLYILRFLAYASFYISVITIPKKLQYRLPVFFVIAGFLVGLFGIAQFFLYPTLQNLYYLGWDPHWYRLFATFFDPNFAGIVLLFPLFFSLYLAQESIKMRDKKKSFLYLASTGFFIVSIFLTFSRTALLALFAGLLVFFLFKKTSKRVVFGIFGLLILGIVIISLNYKATEGTKLYRFASSEARIDSMNAAVSIFSKNPVLGVGFNAYRYAQKTYGYATGNNWLVSHSGAGTDNSILFVLATTGIVGGFAFLYLLFRMGKIVYSSSYPVAAPIAASLVSVAIGSLFINAIFYPAVMFLIWSCLGIMDYTSQ